ncbi:hypothetical protein Tmar_0778 [Thermaerobacter marianensis DSM 12885]|uniref:Hemerythrin-like domain-containing protein n=1 Tax=Thermaerobacter marianensis (strain ATCC 700841 / DSM 12885 / JCM 10246 / 7p75a) TaxID=644966 RepID=E6SII7_THEM7|nr:hypothetical protein Tmar_0778 [Thermaerobacter marianensis DSM 12885]
MRTEVPARGDGAARSGGEGGADRALCLLEDRHRRLAALIGDAREHGAAHRPDLIAELLDELDAHRRLEQEVFYPALRRHGNSEIARHLSARAEEHRQLDRLARRLGEAVQGALGLAEEPAAPRDVSGRPGPARATRPAGAARPAAGRTEAAKVQGERAARMDAGAAQPAGAARMEVAADPAPGVPAAARAPAPAAPADQAPGPAAARVSEPAGPGPRSAEGGRPSPERLLDELATALARHTRHEEGELFPLARRRLGGDLSGLAQELVRGMEEFRFDYDDVVEGTFPASDPPATMAAPRVRTPRLYARSRK